MEPDEILDPNSLERWLESRNQSDGIIIATRAAQRVLPLWSPDLRQDLRRNLEVTGLQVLRELLTSGIAAVSPSPEIRAASIAAFTVANATAYAAPSTPGTYAAAAADAAAATAAAQPGAAYSSTVAKATAAAYSAAAFDDASSFWEEIQEDASALENDVCPLDTPLWSALKPDWFTQVDGIDRAIWQTQDPAHWSFWQRWWDGVISGRQIDWALQEKIALIPDEEWTREPNKGEPTRQARIAERIAEIEGQNPTNTSVDPPDPKPLLDRKRRIVTLQLDALRALLLAEMERIRSRNSRTDAEGQQAGEWLAILTRILVLSDEISAAMQDTAAASSTALVVVEDKLPQIVEEADSLVRQSGEAQISATIVSMAQTIKLLTESGTPPYIASAIAFIAETVKKFPKWRKRPK